MLWLTSTLLVTGPLLQQTPTLTVDLSKPGIPVSSTLYGLMTEEINYSYDGGLYAELLRNRAFKDDPEKPVHWSNVGSGGSIALEKKGGVNAALPISLRFKGAVANDGYWGIPVREGDTYPLSFWAKADGSETITASIEAKEGGAVYAKAELTGIDGTWRKFSTNLKATGIKATKDARLVLRTSSGRTTWLSLVSLFQPTYKNRPNGNRPDIMQKLVDMKPGFLRFPGGNYLEGNTFKDRFDWKKTLGPLENRPGHMAPWSYRSSDGMGLLEFLYWCEDMNAKPVLGVFAGYVLRGDYIGAGPELSGFVQDALDEIEYIVGGTNTKWGAQRAKDGHPKPFPLEHVEIGNEDGFDLSGSYEDRFVQFYDAIRKKYPKLKIISSTGGKDWLGARFPITKRKPDLVDEHYYASTWDMMKMATKYDDYDRKGPKIFVGEWAAQDVPEPWTNPGQKGPTPNMNCALADAAFMTGMERNSDIVEMSCYAPLLVNVNPGGRQWAVNLIGYDALNSFGSPSYYAQKMFAENLGNRSLPTVLKGVEMMTRGTETVPAVFASTTRDTKTGTLYVKVVNTSSTAHLIKVDLLGSSVNATGKEIVLVGDPKLVNSLEEPLKVAPVTRNINGLGSSFNRTFEAHSVTILQLKTNK